MAYDQDYTFSFTWRISNYSLCYQEIGVELRSPVVIAEPLRDTKWNLKICPRGMVGAEEYVSCYLERYKNDGYSKKVHIDFKIKIMTNENKILKYQQCENETFENFGQKGWDKFVEIKEVILGLKNSNMDTLFICCMIKRHAPKIPTAVECIAHTTIHVEHANFECTVSSLGSLKTAEKINLLSSHLLPLEILFSAPDFYLDINIKSFDKVSLVARLKISLLDVEGKEHCSKLSTHFFKRVNENDWRFPSFISRGLLENNKSKFIVNNRLVLKFEISLARRIGSELIKGYERRFEATRGETTLLISLKNDMKHILNSKKHCDVKFRLGEKFVPAHKSILAARSPVFSVMFDQIMVESQSNIVDITDIDENVLLIFLKFLYTSEIDNLDCEDLLQLLIVADKYEVQSLIEECSSLLISRLSKENACEMLTLADMISHRTLRVKALNFMVDNAADILSLPSWNQWTEQNIKLATEFFSRLTFQLKSMINSNDTIESATFSLRK